LSLLDDDELPAAAAQVFVHPVDGMSQHKTKGSLKGAASLTWGSMDAKGSQVHYASRLPARLRRMELVIERRISGMKVSAEAVYSCRVDVGSRHAGGCVGSAAGILLRSKAQAGGLRRHTEWYRQANRCLTLHESRMQKLLWTPHKPVQSTTVRVQKDTLLSAGSDEAASRQKLGRKLPTCLKMVVMMSV
jgi:hypothetical protein